jgi:hypothetical protein
VRYLISVACVLAVVVAPLPVDGRQGTEAKAASPGEASEAASSEPASWLRLQLDEAGPQVIPTMTGPAPPAPTQQALPRRDSSSLRRRRV